jgi:hypothetical protein
MYKEIVCIFYSNQKKKVGSVHGKKKDRQIRPDKDKLSLASSCSPVWGHTALQVFNPERAHATCSGVNQIAKPGVQCAPCNSSAIALAFHIVDVWKSSYKESVHDQATLLQVKLLTLSLIGAVHSNSFGT